MRDSKMSKGDISPGERLSGEIEVQVPVYKTVQKTRQVLVSEAEPGHYETKTVPKTVTDYTHPIISPAANWADIDGDGNKGEQVMGTLRFGSEKSNTYEVTYDPPLVTLVLEGAPPPPQPVKITKPASDGMPDIPEN